MVVDPIIHGVLQINIIKATPPASPVEFWVDASSSWGIGVVFNSEWDFWRLLPGWDKDRHIGWAEMVAVELGLMFASTGLTRKFISPSNQITRASYTLSKGGSPEAQNKI